MLTSLGVGVSDFTDVLIDDSCAREAAEYLAAELCRIGRWRVIDLPEVPDSSATAHLVDAWPGRSWAVSGSVCWSFPARSIQEPIAALPNKTAHTRRKKQRRIAAAGLTTSAVSRMPLARPPPPCCGFTGSSGSDEA